MNIKLKRTDEQVAMIKEMANPDRARASAARQSFAQVVIGPLLQQVLAQAPVLSNLFSDLVFSEGDDNSIPMDMLFDVKEDELIHVWTQNKPGGLATNLVGGSDEIKFSTYELDSAVSLNKKYIANARLDVVSKAITRMAQEFLLKQELTSANVVMAALANASTNGFRHILDATVNDIVKLHDFNRLMTLKSRIWTSFINGTTMDAGARGITDILLSPEVMQSIREIAYNPVSTRDADGSAAGAGDDFLGATDEMRNQVYRSAGLPSIYGINLIQVNELGVGYKYTKIFNAYANGTYDGATFTVASDEILVGIDRGMDSLVRPVKVEGNRSVVVEEDDQFVRRQGKVGWFASIQEGRLVLDNRALVGLIV